METKYNMLERNAEEETDAYKGLSIFASYGVPLGKAKSKSLTTEELIQAREYVLKNCDEAESYLKYEISYFP